MSLEAAELEAVLARALAAGDEALAVATLGALGRRHLEGGRPADALRTFREAADRASALGEGQLGRALGELGIALALLGEEALADRTFLTALAHLRRAGDLAGSAQVAIQRARTLSARAPDRGEAAWADAARRCAVAGRFDDELRARIAAARAAAARGDRARTLSWLEPLRARIDAATDDDVTWARGELGSLYLSAGRGAEALPLLTAAAREEAARGDAGAVAERLHQLRMCRALLGQPT
jgi:tetratricopeptide (TPR) repeat protein